MLKLSEENQKIREMIVPLLAKRKREIIFLMVAINLMLVWLYFSGIFYFAQIMVLSLIVILNIFAYFYHGSSFKAFEHALVLPKRITEVSFSMESMGDGEVIMAVITSSDGETKKFHTRLTNVSTHYVNCNLPFIVFEKNDSPKLLFNEEKLLFALI